MKVPSTLDIEIALAHLRKSARLGRRTASSARRSGTTWSCDACTSISLIAKRPVSTGTMPIPSDSSGSPKVKRSTPVVRSRPMVASSTPKAPAMRLRMPPSPPTAPSIDRPNSASAKYSGGPKL